MKSVGIIGCGWLGKALAKALISCGNNVVTTVRTTEKAQQIMEEGIECYPLSLPCDYASGHRVFQQNTLIIAITPQFKKGRVDYAENIKAIVDRAESAHVEKIILVSSTGSLAEHEGDINEGASYIANDAKSLILQQAEQYVLNSNAEGKVIRMSGLVGDDRKPGRFLAGKKLLKQALAPVNLIHQKDAVGLLLKLIESDSVQQVFHGVSNTRASRKEFYQKAAASMDLDIPTFSDIDLGEDGKRIIGNNTRQWLGYHYQVDDLLEWL